MISRETAGVAWRVHNMYLMVEGVTVCMHPKGVIIRVRECVDRHMVAAMPREIDGVVIIRKKDGEAGQCEVRSPRRKLEEA